MSTANHPAAHRHNPDFSLKNWDWFVVFGIVGMHAAAGYALWNFETYFTWSGFALFLLFCWLTGGIGITLCYHRLLTHRSFRCSKWFEYLITTLGALAWQGGPVQWVGVHRIHHSESDTDFDPHSPKHGFTWSHMLWCMLKCPGRTPPREAARDLQRDKITNFIDNYFWVPQVVFGFALYGIGRYIGGHELAMSWVFWVVAMRIVFVYHGTWFVNSASHTWGYQNFKTTDTSTNLWWVAVLAYGEGWHNNHHAHQSSARHGLRWYEFDLTWNVIKFLDLFGLVWDIKVPTPEQLPNPSLKDGPRDLHVRTKQQAQAIRDEGKKQREQEQEAVSV